MPLDSGFHIDAKSENYQTNSDEAEAHNHQSNIHKIVSLSWHGTKLYYEYSHSHIHSPSISPIQHRPYSALAMHRTPAAHMPIPGGCVGKMLNACIPFTPASTEHSGAPIRSPGRLNTRRHTGIGNRVRFPSALRIHWYMVSQHSSAEEIYIRPIWCRSSVCASNLYTYSHKSTFRWCFSHWVYFA